MYVESNFTMLLATVIISIGNGFEQKHERIIANRTPRKFLE